jgi:hypothetical protein
MRSPKDGRKPSERKPARGRKKPSVRVRTPAPPFTLPPDSSAAGHEFRSFRAAPTARVESTAGLRSELIDLRAEVHRLAAEIDKLWARERGRGAAAPGRTARSIAGKPIRTGTRAARGRSAAAGPRLGSGPKRATGPKRLTGPKRATGPKRTPGPARSSGAKRGAGWAKPKSRSRRSGTTPRRKGR